MAEKCQMTVNILKCETNCSDSRIRFNLSFPQSRISKDFVQYESTLDSQLDKEKNDIKTEYNSNPIGPYMGPYDQSDCIPLKAQLSDSTLDHQQYSQFKHDDGLKCRNFEIVPEAEYRKLDDLEKIDSLQISEHNDMEEDGHTSVRDRIYYTCSKGCCVIPCCCKDCCLQEPQCGMHRICHPDLFDPDLHRRTIRSSKLVCINETFFKKGELYTVDYSEIPKSCDGCGLDLLHHDAYHIEYHHNCKFCRLNKFKYRADSDRGLIDLIKSEEKYYSTVCPYCDNIFCEKFMRKKHIEYAHEEKVFVCEECDKTFSSLNGKIYHKQVVHEDKERVKCDECGKTFAALVSLQNHLKYAHSDIRKFKCDDCDETFKQNKDLTSH